MRTRDLLLAATALGLALAGAGALALLKEDPKAAPSLRDAVIPPDPLPRESGPSALTEPESQGRKKLAEDSVPAPNELADEPPLEPGQTAIRIYRWPDRELLSKREVTLRLLPGLVPVSLTTSARGRVLLPAEHAGAEEFLFIDAEGFERTKVELSPSGLEPRNIEAALKPTEGWYGQVVDESGEPQAGENVKGWWAELPRPLSSAPEGGVVPHKVAQVLKPEPSEIPIVNSDAFFSARGKVEATRTTTNEGWYYVEPRPGDLVGTLSVFVHDARTASDIIRVSIPTNARELPRIVLAPQRFVKGLVVDPEDRSLSGVRVFVELPERGAPSLFETTTDVHGTFSLPVPAGGPVYICAERTGLRMATTGVFKTASADGMWRSVSNLGGDEESALRRFQSGYGEWTSPLPRVRGFVASEHGVDDLKIVMHAVSAAIVVVDAETKKPLQHARISMLMRTHDAPDEVVAMTDVDGKADVSLPDIAWHPVLIRVERDGYVNTELLFPEGKGVLYVRMAPVSAIPELPPGESIRLNIRAPRGKLRGAQAAAYIRVGDNYRQVAQRTAGPDGKVELALGVLEPFELVYAYAWSGHGEKMSAGGVGPYSRDNLLANGEFDVELEPSVEFPIVVRGRTRDRPHRLQVQLGPIKRAAPVEIQWLDIVPHETLNEWRSTYWAPLDWQVRGAVWAAIGNALPTPDFTRSPPLAEYTSTYSRWARWGAVTEGIGARGFGNSRVLDITVNGLISFGGRVKGLQPEAYGSLTVAAHSPAGDWTTPVDLHGTWVFENMPSGKYRLALYATPSPDDAENPLFSSKVHDRLTPYLPRSRHNLVFKVKPEDE